MYSQRMTIGNRLDLAMKAARIKSQSELARASGVPQATISRILKGVGSKGPETETIKKLAKACHVSFSWLNEGEDASGADLSAQSERGEDSYPILDKRIVHAIKLMQQMPEYKLNQTIKIIDTIAEPLPDANRGKSASDNSD
jgi:transcriptional regulator with XRE-family HTH domain